MARIRCRKTELVNEHEKMVAQRNHWSDLVKRLHDYVLKVSLEMMEEGEIGLT